MYKKKLDEELDCGIRVAFKIFGGKWKPCIIDAIQRGHIRPTEMSKNIPNATTRVIEMQLAELLHFGVLERCACEGYPKKSEYKLTRFGQSIIPILDMIGNWGLKHSDFVKRKQEELQEVSQVN